MSATTLYQVTPWPPPANPPCRAVAWPGPGTCVLADADSQFTSTAVATLPTRALMPMRGVEGGVVVLDTPEDPSEPPLAVLIHRNGANTLRPLPASPIGRAWLTCATPQLFAAWPTRFAEAVSSPATNCSRRRLVLWRSSDGGQTWEVGQTGQVSLTATTARRHALGIPVPIPAGTVMPFSCAPAGLQLNHSHRKDCCYRADVAEGECRLLERSVRRTEWAMRGQCGC